MKLFYTEAFSFEVKEYTKPVPPVIKSALQSYSTKEARIKISQIKIKEKINVLTNDESREHVPFHIAKAEKLVESIPCSEDTKQSILVDLRQIELSKLNSKAEELFKDAQSCWLELQKDVLKTSSEHLKSCYEEIFKDPDVKAVYKFLVDSLFDSLLAARIRKQNALVEKKLQFQEMKERKAKEAAENLEPPEIRIQKLEKALKKAERNISELKSGATTKAKIKPKPKQSGKGGKPKNSGPVVGKPKNSELRNNPKPSGRSSKPKSNAAPTSSSESSKNSKRGLNAGTPPPSANPELKGTQSRKRHLVLPGGKEPKNPKLVVIDES